MRFRKTLGCCLLLLWLSAYGYLASLSDTPSSAGDSRVDRFVSEQAMMFHAEKRLAALKIRRAVRWLTDRHPQPAER